MIKIDDGVPIPRSKYPWREMKVGQSFFTEDPKVRAAGFEAGKRLNLKFVSRTVTENGIKGFRIWRTA